MRARLVAVFLAAAAFVSAPSAFAQTGAGKPAGSKAGAEEARKQDAKAKFVQGRDALNRGEYATALVLFRTSQELYPSPGTLLNLALCEERLGMLGSALSHFQEVVRLLPPGDERLSIAKNGAAMIEPRVPRLRIEIAKGAPEGILLVRDGAPVSASDVGKDLPLDPGRHVIVVKAPGRADRPYEVTLAEGAREVFTVEPAPDAAAVPSEPAKLPEIARESPAGPVASRVGRAPDRVDAGVKEGNPMRTGGLVVGGAGVVSLAVGVVTGILAFSKKAEVDSLCPREDVCSDEGVSAERTGKAFAAASTVTVIVGAAGIGAGATLFVLSGSKSKPAAAIGPLVLPGGAGLGTRGCF